MLTTLLFLSLLPNLHLSTQVQDSNKLVSYVSDSTYVESIRSGDIEFNFGNYLAAIPHYKNALIYRPGDAYATSRIQLCELRNREISHFEANVQFNKLTGIGDMYYKWGNFEMALKYYKNAAVVNPSDKSISKKIKKSEMKISN